LGFVAHMIDNGYVFAGPHWQLADSPLQGLYFRMQVYGNVRSREDFEPWLSRIANFPEEVVDQALKQIPPAWLDGDEAELETMLDRLLVRGRRVADLLELSRAARENPFPNWRG
jgi:hypothetical protein